MATELSGEGQLSARPALAVPRPAARSRLRGDARAPPVECQRPLISQTASALAAGSPSSPLLPSPPGSRPAPLCFARLRPCSPLLRSPPALLPSASLPSLLPSASLSSGPAPPCFPLVPSARARSRLLPPCFFLLPSAPNVALLLSLWRGPPTPPLARSLSHRLPVSQLPVWLWFSFSLSASSLCPMCPVCMCALCVCFYRPSCSCISYVLVSQYHLAVCPPDRPVRYQMVARSANPPLPQPLTPYKRHRMHFSKATPREAPPKKEDVGAYKGKHPLVRLSYVCTAPDMRRLARGSNSQLRTCNSAKQRSAGLDCAAAQFGPPPRPLHSSCDPGASAKKRPRPELRIVSLS
eukprot:364332-Chlamydomonas_euryale.AAC.3